MKVIKQLIDHFQNRGILTVEQIEVLRDRGFLEGGERVNKDLLKKRRARQTVEIPPEEWDDFDEPGPSPRDDTPKDSADDPEDRWPRVVRPGKGAKSAKAKQPRAQLKPLAAWLAERFPAWERSLRPLVAVARRLRPCKSCPDAALIVLQAPIDKVAQAITAALAERTPGFRGLWSFLDFDDYRDALDEAWLRGPLRTAYETLLAARTVAEVGRKSWVLHTPETRRLFVLVRAQRAMLRAVGNVFSTQPRVLSRALRRDPHRLGFWALVLLYNGRAKPVLAADPVAPLAPWVARHQRAFWWTPPPRLWNKAWSAALTADSARVFPLFLEFVRSPDQGGLLNAGTGDLPVTNRDWDAYLRDLRHHQAQFGLTMVWSRGSVRFDATDQPLVARATFHDDKKNRSWQFPIPADTGLWLPHAWLKVLRQMSGH